jgi:hypothetical protein
MNECLHCQGENADDATRCAWCGLSLPAKSAGRARDIENSAPLGAWGSDDPLAGLEGLLPAMPPPPMADESSADSVEPTEQEIQDAALFYRIATEPAPLEPPRIPPAAPPPPLLSRRALLILGLLVVLAVLSPLISGGRLDTLMKPSAGEAALAQALGALNAGDRVLVAFDYAPAAASELQAVQNATLADLAARSIRIAALSTRPEGVDLARQSLERLAAADPSQRQGEDVALLGYLAGGDAGVRLALSDLASALGHTSARGGALEATPLLAGLSGAAEMDALLVFTDDGNTARRWVEQAGAWTDAPLLMVTTAAVEPLVMPYAGSGQLAALVSGAYGGLPYAAREGSALYSADAFVALWIVLAVAFVWGLLRRRVPGGERI